MGLLGTVPYLALWVLLAMRLYRMMPGAPRLALGLGAAGFFLHAQIEAVSFTRAGETVLAILLVTTAAHAGGPGIVYLARGAED